MTNFPDMNARLKRAAALLLTVLFLIPAFGCSLRLSSEEQEAEESRREEEARRPPETEPPETVPLNPPPPTGDHGGKTETEAPPAETEEGETEKPDDTEPPAPVGTEKNGVYTSPLYEAGGTTWSYKDGKFTYTLPRRDGSHAVDRDEMYSIPRDMWSDCPADWYGGNWSYNEATGESTLVWQRAQDALDSVAAHHAIYMGDTSRKVIYITFCAGFENGNTSIILDTLKEKHVPAAFFINHWYLSSSPDTVRRMLDEGHIVGNHCVNHPYPVSGLSVEEFYSEVQGLSDEFEAAFPDAPQMIYFRPPSGNASEWSLKYAEMLGYTTVLYTWTYLDYSENEWEQPDLASSFEKLKSQLHPGAVYYFHSTSSTTAAMLPLMIDWVRAQGYEILPICDITP